MLWKELIGMMRSRPIHPLRLYIAIVLAAALAMFAPLAATFAPSAQAYADMASAKSPAISAQSRLTYINSPESGAAYNIGDTVNVNVNCGLYVFNRGVAVTNYITFKVTRGSTKVYYGSASFDSAGAEVGISFTAKKPGKYKIQISSPGFSQPAYSNFEATDSITITVKKAATFKNVEPQVNSVRFQDNRVGIEWAVTGTGTKIYRATERNGKYKLIKTTTKDYIIDNVNAKKDYFYKVQHYLKYNGKTYLSKFSTIESKFSTTPVKPTITSVTKMSKGVRVKWNQPKDCGHFVILRATKKAGTYITLDYVGGDAKAVYTDKTVKAGKKYYYKVEACNYMDWSGDIKSTRSKAMGVKV